MIPPGIFLVVTCGLIWLCRHQLRNPRCHGFYRFFAFEFLLVLALVNIRPAQIEFFSVRGIIAGAFTLASLSVVILGLRELKKAGLSERHRPENFAFENTQHLVTTGIYAYIRHPMYVSLILLGIGIFLHSPTLLALSLLGAVTLFVWLTAKAEETENLAFFGEVYQNYQRNSKMLIPRLI